MISDYSTPSGLGTWRLREAEDRACLSAFDLRTWPFSHGEFSRIIATWRPHEHDRRSFDMEKRSLLA